MHTHTLSYKLDGCIFFLCLQQECRCGSSKCRGVIGGKWQRNGQVGQYSLRATRASASSIVLPPPNLGSHKPISKPSCTGSVMRAQEKVADRLGSCCFPPRLAMSQYSIASFPVPCCLASSIPDSTYIIFRPGC